MSLTAEQRLFLASSPAFDALLQDDPVLAELDASRIDYELERDLLFDAFGGTWTVAGRPVMPITPAVWSVLWAVRSPFVRRDREAGGVRVIDVAVFCHLLTRGVSGLDFGTLEDEAKRTGDSFGLPEDASAVTRELDELIVTAFSPLKMLPQSGFESSEDPVYDSDWLLSVCSVAAREAGITLQSAMIDLPLSVVFGLLVVRARKANPDKHYRKLPPEWVDRRTLRRVDELSEAFVAEHFKPSEPPVRTRSGAEGNENHPRELAERSEAVHHIS